MRFPRSLYERTRTIVAPAFKKWIRQDIELADADAPNVFPHLAAEAIAGIRAVAQLLPSTEPFLALELVYRSGDANQGEFHVPQAKEAAKCRVNLASAFSPLDIAQRLVAPPLAKLFAGDSELAATAAHEAGHLAHWLATQVDPDFSRRIRAGLAHHYGKPVPHAIQTDRELFKFISGEISAYAGVNIVELVAEAVAQVASGPSSALAKDIVAELDRTLSRVTAAELLAAAKRSPVTRHLYEGGHIGDLYSGTFSNVAVESGDFYAGTATEPLRVVWGKAYAFATDERGLPSPILLGNPTFVRCGEPLLEGRLDIANLPGDDDPWPVRAISEPITEVFQRGVQHHRDTALMEYTQQGYGSVVLGVPTVMKKYFERLVQSTIAAVAKGTASLAVDRLGVRHLAVYRVGSEVRLGDLRDATRQDYAPSIAIEAFDGTRLVIDGVSAEGVIRVNGRQLPFRLGHDNQAVWETSLRISPDDQTIDLGDGKKIHLRGVRRIEAACTELNLAPNEAIQRFVERETTLGLNLERLWGETTGLEPGTRAIQLPPDARSTINVDLGLGPH